ncbi:MAG: TerB family tellurite resistance protein [Betaproteobacteria bacterium]|nr:TerB family tellurite resistance protein [Betaproteobacteria bacterium]
MRTYPKNSPFAAARIVAVSMLADGHLCKTELDALDRMHAHALLGISPDELQVVVQGLCEDLCSTSLRGWGAAYLDPGTLTALLAEIDDREIRGQVMGLCVAVAEADAHAADGEAILLTAMHEHWRLVRPFSPPPPLVACPQHG